MKKMSVLSHKSPKDYIELIVSYLKDESKIPKMDVDKETKEWEMDIFSENLFEQLYHNFLYFYKNHQKKNITTEVQNYFFAEIANILDIIHEESSQSYFNNDFVKAILIYIIHSLKTPTAVNPEIVLKIFLGFEDILEDIQNQRIDCELTNFRKEIIDKIKQLKDIYYMNSNFYLNIPNENNLKEIISYLKNFSKCLPIYLKGFIEYNRQNNGKKYLILKIYNYFKIINPFIENKNNTALYLGYSLYGIATYDSVSKINFNEFRDIQTKRIINNDAKNILILATKFLKEKNYANSLKEFEKINFEFSPNTSRILNIFEDTEKYYKDLYNQLKFYINQYKIRNNSLIYHGILNKKNSRVLWLNFIKLLLLNLSEGDIHNDNIKIIFYFIVNLINPDIDSSSLEFREDIIPKLFIQSITEKEILDNPEIYQIIDKDYSEYYPRIDVENNYTQTFINMIDENLRNNFKTTIKRMTSDKHLEIRNIGKFSMYLPFPLLKDYLYFSGLNIDKNYWSPGYLSNFYRNCFFDLEEQEKPFFIGNIRNIEYHTSLINGYDIKSILDDRTFIDCIKSIMISPVMKDVYTKIFYWYSTNGEFDINKENATDIKINSKNNLINGKSIYDYYSEFCDKLNNLDYSKLLIVMNLPESIKPFTFRFLKIVINSQGIKLKNEANIIMYEETKIILLKAYLVFLIINELNHFMKRYLNKNKSYNSCETTELKESKEIGERLIKLLFGHILIKNSINIEEAKYILNIGNWNKKSAYEFKKEFSKFKTDLEANKCLVYLSSEKHLNHFIEIDQLKFLVKFIK